MAEKEKAGPPGAELLKSWRRLSGLSQDEAAAELRVAQSTLSALEAGKQRPGVRLAYRLQLETNGHVPAASWVRADELAVPEGEA